MRKRIKLLSFATALLLFCFCFSNLSVYAGSRDVVSGITTDKGELNMTEWNFKDENVVLQNGKLVIPADTSTEETRFISKNIVRVDGLVDVPVSVSSTMRLTALPKGQQFIFAFALATIEAYSEESGNIEIAFLNENGLYISVITYGEDGAMTVVDKVKCGVSLNSQFDFDASVSKEGTLNIKINGKNICDAQLSTSLEGRFGVLQTGECGAEISKLAVTYNYYDTPENVNIVEDFEKGEFNANALYSYMLGNNGTYPGYIEIEEYNGSNVLMFRNAGVGYIGTTHKYSNFEISFDIPYMQHKAVYDENDEIIMKHNNNVCLGFGEEIEKPKGESYTTDTDFFLFTGGGGHSYFRHTWSSIFAEQNLDICDYENTTEGYSIKFTVINKKGVVQVKALSDSDDKWVTVGTDEYENYKGGYVRIWSSGSSNFAIDNLKITNLDENANLAEDEYVSSVVKYEDYQLTEEDIEVVFRKDTQKTSGEIDKNMIKVFVISLISAVTLVVIGVIVNYALKQKAKRKGGNDGEKTNTK